MVRLSHRITGNAIHGQWHTFSFPSYVLQVLQETCRVFVGNLSRVGKKKTRGPWALTLCLRTWPLTKVPGRYGRIFQLAIFGHETLPLAKVAHILCFYPRGSKWSLFLIYGQRFPIYGSIFEIAIFGHQNWPLAKVEVAHIGSVYLPQGGEIWAYFSSTGSGFQDMGWSSKLPYMGMKLGKWPKFQKWHI